MFRKTTLDSGLRIVTAEMPHARSVTAAIFVGAGSRYEDDEVQGISHFIEHMLFKGTEQRPTSKEISEAIEGIGGIFNAETGKEVTTYWVKVARPHWRHSVEVLTDLVLHPLLAPAEVEKERRVIIEELSMLLDSPNEWVHVLIDEVMWATHPLGHDVAGTRESVSRISRADLLSFMSQHYAPAKAVVALAGPIQHEEAVEWVYELTKRWDLQPSTVWRPAEEPNGAPRVRLQSKETEQAHFCLAVPGLSYVDPERFAMDLLNVTLGEGMSSRLFLELREKQSLAYDVHSYVHRYRDAGSLVVYAGVDPARIEQAVGAVAEQLQRMRSGPEEGEFSRAKEYLKGRIELGLEETHNMASWAGRQELLLGRVLDADEVLSIVDGLEAHNIRRVAERLLRPEKLHLALIGPFDNEERFARLVAA